MADDVIVVTGANSGIGFHLAASLTAEGYQVAALDVADEQLLKLQEIYSKRFLLCRCDVTSDADIARAIAAVLQRWGRIDILVNNAALALFELFEERPIEHTRREFEVNYFGYVRMIAAVLPHMKAQHRGIIHNVSSGVGITGFPGLSGYASTKGAIEALTRTLALEFAREGIIVNLIQPPLTRTKSSAPLGVPARALADPAHVGRKLAKRIGSTAPTITPDLSTALGLLSMRLFPSQIGRLLSRLTERARRTPTPGSSATLP